MYEVIVDYEYRPVVAGINELIDIKWTGGGIIVEISGGREKWFWGRGKIAWKAVWGKITQLEGGEVGVNGLNIAILVTGELNDTAHDRHGTWVMWNYR